MSRILIPEYLLNFARDIYEGPLPSNFGKRLIDRKDVQVLENWYKLFGNEIPANQGKRMVPNYLKLFIQNLANADILEVLDDNVAYIKETPQNALKYAFINKVGGMSYKCNNIISLNDVAETTTNDITYSISNNVLNIKGTANQATYLNLGTLVLSAGTYYFKSFGATGSNSTYFICLQNANDTSQIVSYSYFNGSFTLTETATFTYLLVARNGATVPSGTQFKDMLVSGSIAPTEYQPYFEGIRNSLVTSVNDTTLSANEDKYGWGINEEVYNYRDYDENKGHVLVGRVDLGSLNYTYVTDGTYPIFVSSTISDIKIISSGTPKFLSNSKYTLISAKSGTAFKNNDYEGQYTIRAGQKDVMFQDSNYTSESDFKTAMSGVYLYYELATEVVEDIESIDNVIDVSNNLTFNNEYEQDIPSEITYYVRS